MRHFKSKFKKLSEDENNTPHPSSSTPIAPKMLFAPGFSLLYPKTGSSGLPSLQNVHYVQCLLVSLLTFVVVAFAAEYIGFRWLHFLDDDAPCMNTVTV